MEYFLNILDTTRNITKVGFSLKIDDIPNCNPHKKKVLKWEKKFWTKKKNDDFLAPIDTTFALYRPNYDKDNRFYNAIRTAPPYTARHGGWYIDPNNLTEEQIYYFNTANSSASWKIDKNGKLSNELYKQAYK